MPQLHQHITGVEAVKAEAVRVETAEVEAAVAAKPLKSLVHLPLQAQPPSQMQMQMALPLLWKCRKWLEVWLAVSLVLRSSWP
jgi:hypothetical protein